MRQARLGGALRVPARYGVAGPVPVRHGRKGGAGLGVLRWGAARRVVAGAVRIGLFGSGWQVQVWLARQVRRCKVCSGEERLVRVRTGMAGKVWIVKLCSGTLRLGRNGSALHGLLGHGRERFGRNG